VALLSSKTLGNDLKTLNIRDFNASGLDTEFTGLWAAGDSILALGPHDFKVGQGVKIFGVGREVNLSTPPAPRLEGKPGNVVYRYALAYVDEQGACTSASPVAAFSGGSDLKDSNGIQIAYPIPEGTAAIALYRGEGDNPLQLFHLTGNYQSIRDVGAIKTIEVKGIPNTPPTTSHPGFLLTTITAVTPTTIALDTLAQRTNKQALVVHDDTAAIQKALSLLNTEGGGSLFFPEGTYLVKRLDGGSNLRVYGQGVTLKRQHLVLDGDHWHGNGILSNRLDVRYDQGGNRTGESKNITVEGMTFDGNKMNNRVIGDWSSAALVDIKGCTNLRIEGNKFSNSVDSGCYFAEGIQVLFKNNYSGYHGKPFEHLAEPAIFHSCQDLNVESNTFEYCSDGINLIEVDRAVISNNFMQDCSIGFDLWGAKNTKVFFNRIFGNITNAISVFLEYGGKNYVPSSNVEISDNYIDGKRSDQGCTNTGILVFDAIDWKILRNSIKNCTHGIELTRSEAANSKAGNHIVEGNKIENMEGAGIILAGQTLGKLIIQDNIALTTSTRYPNWGGITLANGVTAEVQFIRNQVNRIFANAGAWLEPARIDGFGNSGTLEGVSLTTRNRSDENLSGLFK
jgi:Pectate lyase superfamily protein/Right handed beta helix region